MTHRLVVTALFLTALPTTALAADRACTTAEKNDLVQDFQTHEAMSRGGLDQSMTNMGTYGSASALLNCRTDGLAFAYEVTSFVIGTFTVVECEDVAGCDLDSSLSGGTVWVENGGVMLNTAGYAKKNSVVVVEGSAKDDVVTMDGNLLGYIATYGGDDEIRTGTGKDYVSAGSGDDVVQNQGGDDMLYGGSDDDILVCGAGNDYANGEGGADILAGEDGDDELRGNTGKDIVWGGAGYDHVWGGAGQDKCAGDSRNSCEGTLSSSDKADLEAANQASRTALESVEEELEEFGMFFADFGVYAGDASWDLWLESATMWVATEAPGWYAEAKSGWSWFTGWFS